MHKFGNLITARDAARMLGVNVHTVNRWAVAGKLPVAVNVPTARHGMNLFDPEEILSLAKKRREEVLARFQIPDSAPHDEADRSNK